MNQVIQAFFAGLSAGSLYAMLGVGVVVIYRVTGLPNFAQGTFAVLAGLVMSSLVGHMAWLLAALIAVGAAALLGVLVAQTVLVRRLRADLNSVITLLAASLIIEGLLVLCWGTTSISYRPLIPGSVKFAGATVAYQDLLVIGACAIAVLALQAFFRRTYLGVAMTACSSQPMAARLSGMRLARMGTFAFAIAGALAGVAGAFATPQSSVVYYGDVLLTINALAAAIVGAMTSPTGALVGGLVLGELSAFVAITSFAQYQVVIALLGMVAVLVFRSGQQSGVWLRARRRLRGIA